MRQGYLEIIIGPMFAGKSTKLIEIAGRYESIQKKILAVNHKIDTRYGENVISSHNLLKKDCISLEKLTILFDNELYLGAEIVIIEEGQFFSDLKEFILRAVDHDKKHVIVAGLIGDYKREPFGDMLTIIPLADSIQTIHAFCKICNDGTPAHFTKRTINKESQQLVGSSESYHPVCRNHYLECS